MLELNNDNNIDRNINNNTINPKQESKTKKKKSILFILVIIYIILSIIFTTGSIIFHNKTGMSIIDYLFKKQNNVMPENNVEDNTVTQNIIDNEIEISELTDKYSINNIELQEIEKEIKKDFVYQDEFDREYKNKLTYYQISGLKNKTIQDNINKDIKQKIEELIIPEEIENDEVDYINISTNVSANFSNLLSISIYKIVYYKEFSKEISSSTFLSLNYRLDNGENLKFEDLFSKTASIKNILSQSLYKDIAFTYGIEYMNNSEDYMDPDMDNVDYSKVEMEVFRLIDSYNKGKDFDFYFTPRNIYIVIGERTVNIDCSEYYKSIQFYNLVKPKTSLYENGDLKKLNYVFGEPFISNCIVFQKITDDIFLSIFSYYNEDINDESYIEFKNLVDENLNYIVALIKQNEKRLENQNGKGKVYNFYYLYNSDEGIYGSGEKVEVDFENFDEEIDRIYSNASRNTSGGDWMLSLYNYENTEDIIQIALRKNENDNLVVYQQGVHDLFWTGSDGTKRDIYWNLIETSQE